MHLDEFKDEYKKHIMKHAERNFSFHFDFFESNQELLGASEIKDPDSPKNIADLFMSKTLLEVKNELQKFIIKLTQIQTLQKVYIGCQRYKAGHFLGPHTDRGQTDYG